MRGQLVQGPLYLVPALGAIDVEEQVNKSGLISFKSGFSAFKLASLLL